MALVAVLRGLLRAGEQVPNSSGADLIQLLPKLKAIVLCGNPAKKAAQENFNTPNIRVFGTYHPAPRAYNIPHQRDHIHRTITDVAKLLNGNESDTKSVKQNLSNTSEIRRNENRAMNTQDGTKDTNPRVERASYTVEEHISKANSECEAIFWQLRERIMDVHPAIKEKAVKKLVGYKAKRNFAEIHFLSNCLKIHLRPKHYLDPKTRVEHLKDPGFTMDRRVYISSKNEIEYVMSLIKQSYEDVALS